MIGTLSRFCCRDSESGCSVALTACAATESVAVCIDDLPEQRMTFIELLERYPRRPTTRSDVDSLQYLAFEILRHHLMSDAHADYSYVEMAAR